MGHKNMYLTEKAGPKFAGVYAGANLEKAQLLEAMKRSVSVV